MRAGTTLRTHVDVILRGPIVQPIAAVFVPPRSEATIAGPEVHLRLVEGQAPHVSVTGPPVVSALVTRPAGAVGSPMYQGWTGCSLYGGLRGMYILTKESWIPWTRRRIFPYPYDGRDCPRLLQWHAVVGWLNYPVTYINYAAR